MRNLIIAIATLVATETLSFGMFNPSFSFNFSEDGENSRSSSETHTPISQSADAINEPKKLPPHVRQLRYSNENFVFDEKRPKASINLTTELDIFWCRYLSQLGLCENTPFLSEEQLDALRRKQQEIAGPVAQALERNLWSQRIFVEQWIPSGKAFQGPFHQVKAACFHDPHSLSPELLKSILEAHPKLLYLDLRGAPSLILSLKDAIEENYPNILIAL